MQQTAIQAYKEERDQCLEGIMGKGMEGYQTLHRVLTMDSLRCRDRLSRSIKTLRTFTYLRESSQAKVRTWVEEELQVVKDRMLKETVLSLLSISLQTSRSSMPRSHLTRHLHSCSTARRDLLQQLTHC